jgi:hypothetical protein
MGKKVGILIASMAVFTLLLSPAFAQFGLTPSASQKISPEGILRSGSGRYVFGQISDSNKDQYMLDTQTGRLWRIGESSDVGTHLKAIPYKDEHGKVFPCPDAAPEQKPKEKPKK